MVIFYMINQAMEIFKKKIQYRVCLAVTGAIQVASRTMNWVYFH